MIFPLFNKWKNLCSYFRVVKSVYKSDLVLSLILSGQRVLTLIINNDNYYKNEMYLSRGLSCIIPKFQGM